MLLRLTVDDIVLSMTRVSSQETQTTNNRQRHRYLLTYLLTTSAMSQPVTTENCSLLACEDNVCLWRGSGVVLPCDRRGKNPTHNHPANTCTADTHRHTYRHTHTHTDTPDYCAAWYDHDTSIDRLHTTCDSYEYSYSGLPHWVKV